MIGNLEQIKKIIKSLPYGKRLSVPGGTLAFIVFNFLMIVGFCRFSFYVLKNHRSSIERESLVETYVDVQPYRTNNEKVVPYPVGDLQDRNAPAPLLKKEPSVIEATNEKRMLTPPASRLKEKTSGYAVFSGDRVNMPAGRPPVIRSVSAQLPKEKKNIPNPDIPADGGNHFETLISSGQHLLNKSEEKVIASERLLQTATVDAEKIDLQQKPAETNVKDVVAESAEKEPVPLLKDKKEKGTSFNAEKGTHWVDVAELRRQLSEKSASVPDQNAAFLNMNQAKQVASSAVKSFPDTSATASSLPGKEEKVKENPVEKAETSVPQTATSLNQNASEPEKAETPVNESVPTQSARPDPNKKRRALSGTSPDLWQVASVKGALSNKPIAEKKEQEKDEERAVEIAKEEQRSKKEVIYRHGREITVEKKPQEVKSLNWLDRKEAAVWTSMAQSDTPSVWSGGAENTADFSDRAKAFRVADEQPAATPAEANVVNSAPVRVIGEEVKPGAKENPLLLPLGERQVSPAANPAAPQVSPLPVPSSSAPVPPSASVPVPKANPNGFSALPSEQQLAQSKNDSTGNSGIMDKFFSFFGKTDVPADAMPSIGSRIPVPADSDKDKEKSISAENKISSQKKKQQVQQNVPVIKAEEKKTLPTELRLTFKPGGTEMSAQSIKWIKAFGQQAKKDIQNAVEIRMSNVDPDLQNKRFSMIRSTLLGAGMDEVQILPVMTDRTPHTIVLRIISLPEEGYTEYTTDQNGVQESLYYKKW